MDLDKRLGDLPRDHQGLVRPQRPVQDLAGDQF
jgi:hypothetical protein